MGSIVSCMSNILYISEKISLCTACIGLICCLVLTITMTLGMGIGLGYNYCFVDMRTKYKYIKGHYIYPDSPRWPHKKEENAAEVPEVQDIAENDALRSPRYKADEDIFYLPDVALTPGSFSEKPRFKNASVGDEDTNYYHPMIPDLEPYNGTESPLKTIVEEAITNATTVVSETKTETSSNTSTNIPESSSTNTSFYESASTTEDTSITEAATEIKDESNEPSPKETTVKDSSSRKVKKLIIPITGLDLISLLSKLSAENKNYSLQVVTT